MLSLYPTFTECDACTDDKNPLCQGCQANQRAIEKLTADLRFYDVQYRRCTVAGCNYSEKRGSAEGHFIEGRFVCRAHAAEHAASRLKVESFAGRVVVEHAPSCALSLPGTTGKCTCDFTDRLINAINAELSPNHPDSRMNLTIRNDQK